MSSSVKPTEFHKWPDLPAELQLKILRHVKAPIDFFNAADANKDIRNMMNDVSQTQKWIGLGADPLVHPSEMKKSVITKIQSFDPHVQSMILNLEESVDIFSEAFGKIDKAMVEAKKCAAEGHVSSVEFKLDQAAEFAKNAGLAKAPALSNRDLRSVYRVAMNNGMVRARQYATAGAVGSMKKELQNADKLAKNAGLEKAPALPEAELKSAYLIAMNDAMVRAEKYAAEEFIILMRESLQKAGECAKYVNSEIPRLSTENMTSKVKKAYVKTISELNARDNRVACVVS